MAAMFSICTFGVLAALVQLAGTLTVGDKHPGKSVKYKQSFNSKTLMNVLRRALAVDGITV